MGSSDTLTPVAVYNMITELIQILRVGCCYQCYLRVNCASTGIKLGRRSVPMAYTLINRPGVLVDRQVITASVVLLDVGVGDVREAECKDKVFDGEEVL